MKKKRMTIPSSLTAISENLMSTENEKKMAKLLLVGETIIYEEDQAHLHLDKIQRIDGWFLGVTGVQGPIELHFCRALSPLEQLGASFEH